jgi:hypothetical protein
VKKIILTSMAAAVALSTGARAQDCDPSAATAAGVIEIVQFRLAESVEREHFVAAAANTMLALCAMDGFIGRVLSEGEDGMWMDHVRWTNSEAAKTAMAGSMENEALTPFIMSIDPNSMVLSYHIPLVLK